MLVRFIKDFWLGIRSIGEAFILILEHWLWIYFSLPIAFSVGIFLGGEKLFEHVKSINIQSEIQHLKYETDFYDIKFEGFPTESEEMKLLLIAVQIIAVVVSLKLSKYIILILMAPIMTTLSSRTEFLLTGNKYPFNLNQFIHDLYRGVNFAIRNLFRQMVIIIIWYLITLVFPVLNRFTFPVIFCLGSFYYGASLMDYTNERRRMSMEESINFIKRHSGIAISIGMFFSALFFIKYIGIIIAPVVCIIAATFAINKRVDLSKNKHALKEEESKPSKKNIEEEEDEWD